MSFKKAHQATCIQEMMWQTILSPQYCTEPIELRKLKEQLANVNCQCRSCNYISCRPLCEKLKHTKDIEVQAERYPIDAQSHIPENKFNNTVCPSCCMTFNMLRGGTVKVLKDEESETLASMFSSDKSTEKETCLQEKTTSVESKPFSEDFNLTCDQCDNTSDIHIHNVGSLSNHRKRHSERVTFQDSEYQGHIEITTKTPSVNCLCLQDFIDSIRPPLDFMSRYG